MSTVCTQCFAQAMTNRTSGVPTVHTIADKLYRDIGETSSVSTMPKDFIIKKSKGRGFGVFAGPYVTVAAGGLLTICTGDERHRDEKLEPDEIEQVVLVCAMGDRTKCTHQIKGMPGDTNAGWWKYINKPNSNEVANVEFGALFHRRSQKWMAVVQTIREIQPGAQLLAEY